MQAPRGAFLLKAPTSFRRRITIADDNHNRRATMIIGTPREIKNHENRVEIGRASCRERVCQYVYISVVDVTLKKKMNSSERSQSALTGEKHYLQQDKHKIQNLVNITKQK